MCLIENGMMGSRLWIATILLTICLSIPRFAHRTPDSVHYVNLAQYFHGDVLRDQLLKPYAYRVLVPFLATLLPIDSLDNSIALINVCGTITAFLVFIAYLKRLGLSGSQISVGTLILVLSFPTFNYASGVSTDPVGFLAFVLGIYFLLDGKYTFVSVTACFGILVRESLLTLVFVAIMDIILVYSFKNGSRRRWREMLIMVAIVSLPPILTFAAIRAFLFPDVHDVFYWGISSHGFLLNVTQPKIGWLTFLVTLCPQLMFILYGILHNGLVNIKTLEQKSLFLLASVTVVSILYIIYSNCLETSYMSGRFVWPFYSVLVPLSVLSIQHTSLFTRFLEPMSRKILG
jgi:hypothetical protein